MKPIRRALCFTWIFMARLAQAVGQNSPQAAPGEEKVVTFKAMVPGPYVYHCATPSVPHHTTNGMYGLLLVEPEGGLPQVNREFYVMQGELYTTKPFGSNGHQEMNYNKLISERPEYFVFNGALSALTKAHPLRASIGETMRIFFGVGGPNFTSSFHVIGAIFDRVYEGAKRSVFVRLISETGLTKRGFMECARGSFRLDD